jgi:hypothetical protein
MWNKLGWEAIAQTYCPAVGGNGEMRFAVSPQVPWLTVSHALIARRERLRELRHARREDSAG